MIYLFSLYLSYDDQLNYYYISIYLNICLYVHNLNPNICLCDAWLILDGIHGFLFDRNICRYELHNWRDRGTERYISLCIPHPCTQIRKCYHWLHVWSWCKYLCLGFVLYVALLGLGWHTSDVINRLQFVIIFFSDLVFRSHLFSFSLLK